MLTKEPTQEMIKEWKRIFEQKRESLKPNRKSGEELNQYLKTKYKVLNIKSKRAKAIVIDNIMLNSVFRERIPQGELPNPATYYLDNGKVFVGIDLKSGYFCVEGSEKIYDDLFAFRGLDEKDLENYFLVAEYIKCCESNNK